ncbi:MAG: outer membrane protein [Gammaproteobacteria bacterium]
MRTYLKYLLLISIAPAAVAFGEFAPITTFSAGPAWENNGDAKTINVSPSVEQHYTVNDGTETLGQGELFLASGFKVAPQWRMNLGILLGAIEVAEISGDVLQHGVDVGSYEYRVSHLRTGIKDKVLFDFGSPFLPWASFSIGASFNHAYNFESDTMPTFRSNIMPSFTYSLGAGFQYAFSDHWQIGMGYEFTDWGKHELDEPVGYPGNDYLSSANFYTHGLLFNIAYSD